MKRLTVALLLLAVAIPCNASEWINSHALYMYFANAEGGAPVSKHDNDR